MYWPMKAAASSVPQRRGRPAACQSRRNDGIDSTSSPRPTTAPATRNSTSHQNGSLSSTRFIITMAMAISAIASAPSMTPRRKAWRSTASRRAGALTTSRPAITSRKPSTCSADSRSPRNTNDSTITNGLYRLPTTPMRPAPMPFNARRYKVSARAMPIMPLARASNTVGAPSAGQGRRARPSAGASGETSTAMVTTTSTSTIRFFSRHSLSGGKSSPRRL